MIVLDTHVLVWWIGKPELLSKRAKKIDKVWSKRGILVSSISIWEICLLVKRGRLRLTMDVTSWVKRVEELPFIRFVPVDNNLAARSVFLPEPLHQDPADRIIIATALQYGAAVVTSDQKILNYPQVRSMW